MFRKGNGLKDIIETKPPNGIYVSLLNGKNVCPKHHTFHHHPENKRSHERCFFALVVVCVCFISLTCDTKRYFAPCYLKKPSMSTKEDDYSSGTSQDVAEQHSSCPPATGPAASLGSHGIDKKPIEAKAGNVVGTSTDLSNTSKSKSRDNTGRTVTVSLLQIQNFNYHHIDVHVCCVLISDTHENTICPT